MRNQKGFTLIEIIIAVALMGILAVGIATLLQQLARENVRSSGQMTAIQQNENAGYWLTRDGQMANTVTPGGSAGFPLVLNWEEYNGDDYTITYSLSGTQLRRSMVKNANPAVVSTLASAVNPASAQTNCSYSGNILTFNLTCSAGGVSETRTFKIKKRAG